MTTDNQADQIDTRKTVREYLLKPYHIVCVFDSAPYGGWSAHVREWPGCSTSADTWNQLIHMINDAMTLYVSSLLNDNLPVPEPDPD